MTISRSVSAGKRGLRRIQADNETKIRGSNWIKVKNVVCDSWAICTNSSYHKRGRIWLIWQPSQVVVNVQHVTAQLIHAKVFDKTRDCQFWFTLVYGFNKDKDRESLWESLITLGKRVDNDCHRDLTELKTIGSFFTWNNKHENGSKVYSKIDRVLVNADWLNDFPDCFANFLPEWLFDHCPCVIYFQEERERKGSPFKYFNMWSLVDDFLRVVETHWKKTVNGNPMFQVTQKLKTLKHSLKQLDRHNFSDIENITHVTEVALEGFQKQLRLDPLNQEICNTEYACSQELRVLKTSCTQYLQQKSKEN
ncbi:uncharacterized protein LOC141640377 [Silene latifolia]|uniref:uncharacterized protein LOC141640377 n=1 Tax=Silene latifolia TaxID=37657 RepID=UPI003D776B77